MNALLMALAVTGLFIFGLLNAILFGNEPRCMNTGKEYVCAQEYAERGTIE